jgi:hypothetical protein
MQLLLIQFSREWTTIDYTVSTGFDTDQYWTLNETCRRFVNRLDAAFEENAQIQDDASIWISILSFWSR